MPRATPNPPYRDQALRILPWICARCAREFPGSRLRELTVHHKDGNHDHNPPDGSNWELLCIYCHENEHARVADSRAAGGGPAAREPASAPMRAPARSSMRAPARSPARAPARAPATHRPFADLEKKLRDS